jgi:hypothetical protein
MPRNLAVILLVPVGVRGALVNARQVGQLNNVDSQVGLLTSLRFVKVGMTARRTAVMIISSFSDVRIRPAMRRDALESAMGVA